MKSKKQKECTKKESTLPKANLVYHKTKTKTRGKEVKTMETGRKLMEIPANPITRYQQAFDLIQDVMDLLPTSSIAFATAQETMAQIEDLIWNDEEGGLRKWVQ